MNLLPSVSRLVVLASLSGLGVSTAQINAGSTGADGPLTQTELDALDAADGAVDGIATIDLATMGTYDSSTWRVVFHYTTVNVPSHITVKFANHPSRAPVVWLSQTDIVIDGGLDLAGQDGVHYNVLSEPGPGGFRGGRGQYTWSQGWNDSSGLGPGGGFQYQGNANAHGNGGAHATLGGVGSPVAPSSSTYGDAAVTQLIGGSGGAGGRDYNSGSSSGGGAGGGAILLAADDSIQLGASGWISVAGGLATQNNTGGGAGSGGAVRLVSDSITTATGSLLEARGGYQNGNGRAGGVGRIRLEANTWSLGGSANPTSAMTSGLPGPIAPPANAPTVRIESVGGVAAPLDPRASLGDNDPTPDVDLATGSMVTVRIVTTNVDLGSAVYLRTTGSVGPAGEVLVTDGVTNPLVVTGGPNMEAEAFVTVDLQDGYSALQARVVFP